MTDTRTFHLTKIDWRWLVVTYCLLVLFHLLPSLLAIGLRQFFLWSGGWRFGLWTGGGILLVSAYVGRRSNGITILEPGLASLLYMATLIPTVTNFRDFTGTAWYQIAGLLWSVLLMAFVVGCFGAAAGEWLQSRKLRAGDR